jgi:hypothetical protein
MSLKDRAWLRGFAVLGFGPAALAVIRQGVENSCHSCSRHQTRCRGGEPRHR